MAFSVGTNLFGSTVVSTTSYTIKASKPLGGVNGSSDAKLSRIINKFKCGKKLSGAEMTYVAKLNQAMFQKILKISRERDDLEKRMESAQSKEEVAKILNEVMGNIDKLCGDEEFDRTARVNQYTDAYTSYMETKDYQEKPTSSLEAAEHKRKRIAKKSGFPEDNELQKKKQNKKMEPLQGMEDVLGTGSDSSQDSFEESYEYDFVNTDVLHTQCTGTTGNKKKSAIDITI